MIPIAAKSIPLSARTGCRSQATVIQLKEDGDQLERQELETDSP
jgi:hypothetical protein